MWTVLGPAPATQGGLERTSRSDGPGLRPILFRGAWLSGGALPAWVGRVFPGGNVGRGALVNLGSFALHGHHGNPRAVSVGPGDLVEGEPPGAGSGPSIPRRLAARVAPGIARAAGAPRAPEPQSPPGRLRARTPVDDSCAGPEIRADKRSLRPVRRIRTMGRARVFLDAGLCGRSRVRIG